MKKYTIQLIHALSVGSGAGLIEIDVDSYTCDSISAPFLETMHEGKVISIPVHNIKAIVHNEPTLTVSIRNTGLEKQIRDTLL